MSLFSLFPEFNKIKTRNTLYPWLHLPPLRVLLREHLDVEGLIALVHPLTQTIPPGGGVWNDPPSFSTLVAKQLVVLG